jgi:hypothetical protein
LRLEQQRFLEDRPSHAWVGLRDQPVGTTPAPAGAAKET